MTADFSNPFSTKYIRPGAIEYRRADGGTLEQLVTDFDDRCHGMACIIGPHGTGKSTLIACLKSIFEQSRPVFAYRLTTQERSSREIKADRNNWPQGSLVIVDGYEQLSRWSSWRLRVWVRRRQASLLVTAHRKVSYFDVLWKTSADERLGRELRNLLLAARPDLLASKELESAWQAARNQFPTDLRETFFAMYDWVEKHPRNSLR